MGPVAGGPWPRAGVGWAVDRLADVPESPADSGLPHVPDAATVSRQPEVTLPGASRRQKRFDATAFPNLPVAMKLRSALLVACMIVVPSLAMFSHKIPSSTRVALRRQMWEPMIDTARAACGLPAVEQRAPAPFLPTGPMAGPPATAPRAEQAPSAVTPPGTLPGTIEARPMEVGSGLGADEGRLGLEARLRSLGATRIEWTPAQGGDGLHRCSCRIPAEPTGQLHRVFQAAAADPVAALDSLVGQVTTWSMRVRPTDPVRAAAAPPHSSAMESFQR
jgi:hypothetical protein